MRVKIRQILKEEQILNKQYVFGPSYVSGVLGITIPINESHPYSESLKKEIIKEQLLFENFWDDAKNLTGKTREFFLALKRMFSDPGTITTWCDTIKTRLIDKPLKIIQTFLNNLMEKLKSWDMTKSVKIVKDVYDVIERLTKKVYSYSGWKSALTMTGLSLVISWLWDNIGGLIVNGVKMLGTFKDNSVGFMGWFSEVVLGKVFDVMREKLGGFLSSIGASLTGIGGFISWAKKAFDGLTFILDTLDGVIKRYLGKGVGNQGGFFLDKERKWSRG